MQLKMIEDCLRDIHTIGGGNEKAKVYCRAEYNTPETSVNTEVKTMKKLGLCYKCK